MASTYSTNYGFELPGSGEQAGTWDVTMNLFMGTLLEAALGNSTSITMTDANYTLSTTNGATNENRYFRIVATGTNTAQRDIIVATSKVKSFLVVNNTTGGFAVRAKTSAGTGITIPNGMSALVYADGTNVVDFATLVRARLYAPDGTAAAPGVSFADDTDNGLYRIGADSVGMSLGGTLRTTYATTGTTKTVPDLHADGSNSAPSVSFSGDTNTGLYRVGSDSVGMTLGGTVRTTYATTGTTKTVPDLQANGSEAAPSYAFSGQTSSGMYLIASGEVGLSAAGTKRLAASSVSGGVDVFGGLTVSGSGQVTGSFIASNLIRGSGSPEGVVTATVGALYQRVDGGASTTLYVKESGSGNTGWVAK